MRLGFSTLIWLLCATAPQAAATTNLTIRAYDPEGQPYAAPVLADGKQVGETWTPIALDAGRHRIVVACGDRYWAGECLLLAGARQTLTATLCTRPVMIAIESGSFLMGSPAGEPGREEQNDEEQHRVEVTRGFWLTTTEVSQALYEEVCGANPSRWIGPSLPVENVTWFDCMRFCNRLSEFHGYRPAYMIDGERVEWDRSADGYRLPTEAEWEYACRAGASTAFGFGDDADLLHLYANYCDRTCEREWRDTDHDDGFAFTAPVGSFRPNAWGLHDLHGNVWEWCWDWWEPFTADARSDPTGPPNGTHKVEKGGCWEVGPDMCRQAYRHYVEPDQKRSYLGFRIARTAR